MAEPVPVPKPTVDPFGPQRFRELADSQSAFHTDGSYAARDVTVRLGYWHRCSQVQLANRLSGLVGSRLNPLKPVG